MRTTRKSRKRKGGAFTDPTEASFLEFKNDLYCSKNGECHVSIHGLNKIFQHAGYRLNLKGSLTYIVEDNRIISFIRNSFLSRKHLLIHVNSFSHHWFLEIYNAHFRILSLYAGKHGFYDNMVSGSYGKFQDIHNMDTFMKSFYKLLSRDRELIIAANLELFNTIPQAYFDPQYSSRLRLVNIYEIECTNESCREANETATSKSHSIGEFGEKSDSKSHSIVKSVYKSACKGNKCSIMGGKFTRYKIEPKSKRNRGEKR
jgi:hypothetical protein